MAADTSKQRAGVSRRSFLRTSALAGGALATSVCSMLGAREAALGVHAAGSDTIRVGLIGCGRRGTDAAKDCVRSSKGVEIVALGDLFGERLENSRKYLTPRLSDAFSVDDKSCFTGFDAFRKVIASDVDLVILATPPHFRPEHLAAAIEAGKHVFMEKPVAVDPVGARRVMAASALAEEKGLAIVAGAQCCWNGALTKGHWKYWERAGLSEMEWQCRNWPWFTWLSGDHIVQQHVHNLEVMNRSLGSHPVKATCTGQDNGNIVDHDHRYAVEYEYPGGVRITGMARRIDACDDHVSERLAGTKGVANLGETWGSISGKKPYKFDGTSPNPDNPYNPHVQEHTDLIASIRSGKPINEGRRAAESTLTAIMGRMSAYTGQAIDWDWVMNKSQLDLRPAEYDLAADPQVRTAAIPRGTKLI